MTRPGLRDIGHPSTRRMPCGGRYQAHVRRSDFSECSGVPDVQKGALKAGSVDAEDSMPSLTSAHINSCMWGDNARPVRFGPVDTAH